MAISFRQKFGGWKLLDNGLRPRLEEMPELVESHAQLVAIIARAEALQAETEALKGSFQKMARLRRELETAGEDLRRRIGAALQFRFGFEDETLLSFGLFPRRKRKRRSAADERENPPAGSAVPIPLVLAADPVTDPAAMPAGASSQ